MHLLHKGCLCVYEPAWLKDTSNLGNDLPRIEYVFQDRLDDDAIKRIVWEGDTMRVCNDLDLGRGIDVKGYYAEVFAFIEWGHTLPDRTSTND